MSFLRGKLVNAGPAPARLKEFITPAGLENYFAELFEILGASRPPDFARIAGLYARYGCGDACLDWIPELEAKYGVRAPH